MKNVTFKCWSTSNSGFNKNDIKRINVQCTKLIIVNLREI